MKKKLKDFFVIILCLSACALLCIKFETVSYAVVSALKLCAKTIIPSLFPFFVISDMLISCLNFDEKSFSARIVLKIFNLPPCAVSAFVLGLISGYPVGASVVMRLYENDLISKDDAEHLICLTNNSGPLFLICSVGCGMFGSMQIGIMLYAVHVFTALCMALVAGRLHTVHGRSAKAFYTHFNLAKSVERGFMQCIKITGFVVFFAIVNEFVLKIADFIPLANKSPFAHACLLSVFEMTNAVSRAAAILPLGNALCLTSFAAAWSGLSVLFQVKAVTKNVLSVKKYVKYKFFSGLAAAAITASILKIGKNEFEIGFAYIGHCAAVIPFALCIIISIVYCAKKRCRKTTSLQKNQFNI